MAINGRLFLQRMLGYEKYVNGRQNALRACCEVSEVARALATVRVGNIPYGILPVSRIRGKSDNDRLVGKLRIGQLERSPNLDWATFNISSSQSVECALASLAKAGKRSFSRAKVDSQY